MTTEAQEKVFLEFYEILHDKLTKNILNDFTEVNTLVQNTLKHVLNINKGVFSSMPSKSDLLKVYQQLVLTKKLKHDSIMETLLTTRVIRSSSGVLPISIALDGRSPIGNKSDTDEEATNIENNDMEEGFSCSYNCAFCPNECVANGAEKDIARSYLSSEGTFIRGAIQNFNTIEQVWRRLAELEIMGHIPDKLEIIPLGGTWDCYPRKYRERFALELFYACNTYKVISIRYNGKHSQLLKEWVLTKPFQNNLPLSSNIREVIYSNYPIQTLDHEKITNTKSICCRIIGIVLETRPDRISRTTLLEKRLLGCTRIQLGIQHTDNDVLHFNNRGHSVEATIRAIRSSRDAGFKIDGHIMPDLPFSNVEKDYEMVKRIFSSSDLQLDYCKIYPCLDLPYTLARKWKKDGTWKPYAEYNFTEFLKLLSYTLTIVPPWTRINRVQRDFPVANEKNNGLGFVSNTIKTNLQQIVHQEISKNGKKCFDIRNREIKNTILTKEALQTAKLYIRVYRANEGTEFFISVEIPKSQSSAFDDTYLLGLCRLRLTDFEFIKNNSSFLPPHYLPTFRNKCQKIAKIRELHVYGNIATKSVGGNSQHKGIGRFLIGIAETISRINNFDIISVISGVGVRDYYENLGYILGDKEDEYMIKNLHTSIPLPNILFGNMFSTRDIRHSILNSIISKKYHSTKDISNNTKYTKFTYEYIQNGEPEGFSISYIKPNNNIILICFILGLTFMYLCIQILFNTYIKII